MTQVISELEFCLTDAEIGNTAISYGSLTFISNAVKYNIYPLIFSFQFITFSWVEMHFLHSSCGWGKLMVLVVRSSAWGMEALSDLGVEFLPWCPMQGLAWLCCVQTWSWEGSWGASWVTAQELIAGMWPGAAPQALWNSRMAFCSFLTPLGFGNATGMCHCLGWRFSNAWLEKSAFSQAFQPGIAGDVHIHFIFSVFQS